MGAVREWITVAPLCWIQHLRAAGLANRRIGSNTCAVLAAYTLGDAEVLIVEQGQNLRLHAFDLRQRRRLGVQSREELRDGAGVSGSADQYSKAVI